MFINIPKHVEHYPDFEGMIIKKVVVTNQFPGFVSNNSTAFVILDGGSFFAFAGNLESDVDTYWGELNTAQSKWLKDEFDIEL